MRLLRGAVLGSCCLLLAACGGRGPNPEDGSGEPEARPDASRPQTQPAVARLKELIVGKWELEEQKSGYRETLEFTADGKVTTVASSKVETHTWDNTYTFLDDHTLQFYARGKPTSRYKVEVSKTDLALTDTKDSKLDRYKRLLVAAAPVAQGDHGQIQGKWKLVKYERAGRQIPLKRDIATFTADKFTFPVVGDDLGYRLDPARTPKQIDLLNAGTNQRQTWHGIYELDGDMLKLCVATGSDQTRPDQFTATGVDSSWMYISFQRMK